MGLIDCITNGLSKRWLKKQGVKLTYGIRAIPRGGTLILERGASIHCQKMRFSELAIGAMTYIRGGSELLNVQQIGRFCSISNNVVIGQSRGGRGHPLSWVSTHPFQVSGDISTEDDSDGSSAVVIGNDVWIGRDAMVMEGLTIGTGAVVAGRSLVTRSVPDYAIVAGTPARIVRFRHPPELARRLLDSRWWEVDLAALRMLPLDQPDLFLQALERVEPARYNRCVLTRSSWKAL